MTNEDSAKFLKDILESSSVNYVNLAKRLNRMGAKEDNSNLSNKINRGAFSLTFTLQVIDVLGLELTAIPKSFDNSKRTISKDEFIEKYIQTSKLLQKAEESDFILKLIDDTRDELLSAAGFMPEVIEHFHKNYNEIKTSENIEEISSLYNKLCSLNDAAIEAKQIIKKINTRRKR